MDVARLAGVSIGTVSNVLANRAAVRPATRRRVEAAIAELKYRPNRIARSLVGQRTHVVGMVVPDVANPFFAELMQGAEEELESAGYAVVFGNSHGSEARQLRYLESFRDRQVDGLILVLAPSTEAAVLSEMGAHMALVLVDRSLPDWRGDQVVGDDEAGMQLAVGLLAQMGHRRLGLINGEPGISTARRRRLGFEASLRKWGLDPRCVTDGSFTMGSGFAQAARLLDVPEPPTAICAGNDLLAMAALAAATGRGLRVPQDVSIVGYDDIAYARLLSPGLTTVRQPAASMGAEAARLLLERIDRGRTEPRTIVIRPELVVRGSTGPAPAV